MSPGNLIRFVSLWVCLFHTLPEHRMYIYPSLRVWLSRSIMFSRSAPVTGCIRISSLFKSE